MSGGNEQESVEVTYSVADIWALNLLVWPFWLRLVALFAAIVIALPVIFSLIGGYSLSASIMSIDWGFTARMVLIIVAWLILVTVFAYWLRRKRGLHGPMRFWLTTQGVAVRNRQMDVVVFWSAIRSMAVRRSRLFLFLSRRSALIVPQRVFDSDPEFETFVNAARHYWEARHRP